jgi:hypothetical protein
MGISLVRSLNCCNLAIDFFTSSTTGSETPSPGGRLFLLGFLRDFFPTEPPIGAGAEYRIAKTSKATLLRTKVRCYTT